MQLAFPSPTTSCFPLGLHDAQLMPCFNIGPCGPVKNCLVFIFAINISPFVVIKHMSSAFSNAGFGTNALSDDPFVGISNAGLLFPLLSACVS